METPNSTFSTPKKDFDFHKVFAAIGVMLVIAIPIIAGVWYYSEGRFAGDATNDDNTVKTATKSAKTATSLAKTATNSSTSLSEKEGWKKYTNTSVGFSIDYPVAKLCSKQAIEERAGTIDKKDALKEVAFKAYDCLSDYSVLVAKMSSNYSEPTTKFGQWDFVSEKDVTIDGVKTKIKTYGADPGIFELAYLKKADSVYLIVYGGSLSSQSKQGDEITSTEFEKMLSTFKFL